MKNQVQELDRPFLQSLRVDLNKTLAAVGEKHGIVIATGTCRFTPTKATMKIEILVKGEGVEDIKSAKLAQAGRDFKANARRFGLQPMWLNKSFKHTDGRTWKVIGLMPRRRKFPVLCTSRNGEESLFPVPTIQYFFSKHADV